MARIRVDVFKQHAHELTFHPLQLTWYRRLLASLIAIALLMPFYGSAPSMAQDIVPVPTPAATEGTPAPVDPTGVYAAPVKVGDRTILEVVDSTEAGAQARADRVNRRLERLIEREEEVPKFTRRDLVTADGQPLISLGGEPVLTVTAADAERNLLAPRELALMWGGKLSVAVTEARNANENPLRGVGYLVRYSIRDLVVSVSSLLPRLVGAIFVWGLFWLLARAARGTVTAATNKMPLDANLRQLTCSLAFYGVWAAGLVVILSTLGIDSTSIATAVGISGFVLGFAFKDILSHFFAGLSLLMSRQFHIGGQIVVGEFEGVVERIELRALYLRTFDNRLVSIPNGDVFTSTVISNTSYSYRRREFVIGIAYEEDIQHALDLAMETMRDTEGVLDDPEPLAIVDGLGQSSINIKCYYYINSTDPRTLHIISDCIRNVKEAFDREKISIPYEVRSIRLRNPDEISNSLRQVFAGLNVNPEAEGAARPNGGKQPALNGTSEKPAPENAR